MAGDHDLDHSFGSMAVSAEERRARIRQVRVVHSTAWAQVGRVGAHASHRLN